MNRRVSLEQLLKSTTFQPAEAVAIVQQLIVTRTFEQLTPPLGPPTTATVLVGGDGSVTCATSDSTFAVSELAALLDALLPPGGTPPVGVPGGLRYTIARARLEVDAPPFDSLDDFSHALSRHERGDRTVVIQRMLARANRDDANSALDRRRADPAVAQLRRQLRDADARVYDQQRALDAIAAMSARPPATKRAGSIAAGMLIGMTFAGLGGMMRDRSASPPEPPLVTQTEQPSAPVAAAPEPVVESTPVRTTTTPNPKRAAQVTPKSRDREPTRPRRFQWLRTRFSFRADPL